ncbi:GDSL-type esterase/lipase family protein [Sphingomonas sp. RS6]
MPFPRRSLLAGALATPIATRAAAACVPDERTRQQLFDWPDLGRYARDNAALIASGAPVRVVFMGDSITQGWRDKRPGFFVDGRFGRGIGGQTTPQMLVRMMADVIALRPRAVHIMGGTNDIAGNTGPMSPRMSHDMIAAMRELAGAHGIEVLLASVPPAGAFGWRPGLDTVTPIRALNDWIRDYAAQTGAHYVDYHPVLATPQGAMQPGLASDGVHPTEPGYLRMESVLLPLLRKLDLA